MLAQHLHHPAPDCRAGLEEPLNSRVSKLDLTAGICNQHAIRHAVQDGCQPGAFRFHYGVTHSQGQRQGFDGIGEFLQGW